MGATSQSYTRKNRLLDAPSFDRVFKRARRSSDRLFTVLYRQQAAAPARLGLAISKKNCRLAVARNRLKRIIRESFRQHLGELHGIDVVVLNKSDTHQAVNKVLFDSLARHWRQCKNTDKDLQDKR